MAQLKTLDDLKDWTGYRKFLNDGLKTLGDEEVGFHVSKDDFEFSVKGSTWPGRVVLFGDKADTAMASLKRAGIQFRSGTCHRKGKKLQVTGVAGSVLKAGNKTLDKLPLSCTAVVAGEPEADGEGVDRKLKASVYAALKEALAAKPKNRSELVDLYGKAEAAEKKGDADYATKILNDLKQILASAPVVEDFDDDTDEADDAAVAALAAQQKKELYPRIKEVLTQDPSQRASLGGLVKAADAYEKAGNYEALLEQYAAIEDTLESLVETDDPELTALGDWVAYRKFFRVRMKKLSKDSKQMEPFYIGRKKTAFQVGGKTWRGHAVLAGNKASVLVKALKREGTLFLTGECYLNGKELQVSGIGSGALKAASKTLKALRLGYTATAVIGATEGPTDMESALSAWQSARTAATSKLKAIARDIAAAKHAKSAQALIELKAVISQISGTPDTAQKVSEMQTYLEQDDVVQDVCEMADDIRSPLLAATSKLMAAVS